jgi:hypothetical protein
MPHFSIEPDDTGKFVLVNHDTGQRTTYATLQEAEGAKEHLTQQSQAGDNDS